MIRFERKTKKNKSDDSMMQSDGVKVSRNKQEIIKSSFRLMELLLNPLG